LSAVRPRIKTVAVFVWSLAVWSATGCATGARYVRPAPPTQTKYLPPATARLAGNAAAAAPHVTMGSGPPQRWWTLLGSDDIDRLVMRALQNNQSLAGAKAHLAAAREQLRAARGAWYPQVDAAAGAQRTRFGATVLGPLAKDFPPFSAYAAGAEVSYDIDVFGGTRSHVEQTAAAEQYRSAQLGAVALSVSGNVVIQVRSGSQSRSWLTMSTRWTCFAQPAKRAPYRGWMCSAHKANSTTIAPCCHPCTKN
jgi:outer membrane protein TolC